MKKYILFTILSLLTNLLIAQVGINTEKPNDYTSLHVSERLDSENSVPDNFSGIMIQKYTEVERDTNLTPNMEFNQNSLLIYNTTEDCYNYWNNAEKEWKSLCGALGKSEFTINCASIVVNGSYVIGRELTSSNYLSIPINVTKPGEYTIIASTSNGYSFFASGTFLETGNYTIQASGQGTPIVVQTDELTITANGLEVDCNPKKTITVMSAAGTYTMSCGSAVVNGIYKVGTALNSTNTITLPLVVTSLGSYTITTNTVDGISFSGSGVFTSIGNQNVTLYGIGTPTSTSTKNLTITSDSQGEVSTTCNVNVITVIPKKRILALGLANGYGYPFNPNTNTYRLVTTSSNFGTNINSVVKFEGFTEIIQGGSVGSATETELQNWLLGSNPVDILILGFDTYLTTSKSTIIAQYLAKGGVLLAYTDRADDLSSNNLLKVLLNNPSISTVASGGAGTVYQLGYENNEILNGPFGDIRGKYWGEDASVTASIPVANISSNVTVLSRDSSGRAVAFKHNTLNMIWVGDGGFNSGSNMSPGSSTICPFNLDASYFPIPKTTFSQPVYNSIFTANAIAWAIKQAENNGINTH